MYHFCTLFDKNYIHKGVALYRSLCDTMSDYGSWTLHILCADEEVYETLLLFPSSNIQIVSLRDLEEVSGSDLPALKELPASLYGSQRDNYLWALAPYFIDRVLAKHVREHEMLMYVDSDIYFYTSPEKIFDLVRNHSMGIHTHRFGWPFQNTMDVGWFNVGVVVFKGDFHGKRIAAFWKSLVMSHDHPSYKEYGTCGDQKYLDLIYQHEINHIMVFDQHIPTSSEHPVIHHGAPWCAPDEGREIDFYHFSHFSFVKDNYYGWAWKDNYHGEWNPTANPSVKALYEKYFEQLKRSNEIIHS